MTCEWSWLTLVTVTCLVCMAELLVMNPRAAVSQLKKQAEAGAVQESCTRVQLWISSSLFSTDFFFFLKRILLLHKVFCWLAEICSIH